MSRRFELMHGLAEDKLKLFKDNTFHTAITSPPYWQLRDYFVDGQLGREATPEEYVENLVSICREVKRVLRKDGTFWLNIGDGYNNNAGFSRATKGFGRKGRKDGSADRKAFKHKYIKRKDLIGMPWKVAFALQKDGWYLRCDIIWEKSNPMPDGAKDRPTRGHEYLFLLTKSPKYFYDYYRVLENTEKQPEKKMGFGANEQEGTFRQDQDRVFEHYGKRNKRSVWKTSVASFKGKHYATFPMKLIEPCVRASISEEGCCPKCMSPWERIFEKYKKPNNSKKGYTLKLIEKGWKPTCKCGLKEKESCIVLDPFSGMATTGVVNMHEWQDYVGIEPNEEYLNISRDRLKSIGVKDTYTAEVWMQQDNFIDRFMI